LGFSWAAALQRPAATPTDSVVVESPLPGGVAAVTRFLLNAVPQWVQISGAVLAVFVGGILLWVLFRRRHTIRTWLGSRGRATLIALSTTAAVVALAAAAMGRATWNYTQHSNEFCTGCHVMAPAFQRFTSTTNKHGELSCHDCHQQSILASARQVYLWVAERPEKIGMHSKVPNRVCETCHVTGDTAKWQRVASTAGHRVHLESDSSALKDVQCVTCHGMEVHRFRPVSGTCGQSGCHEQSKTRIVLGKMAEQTVRHCTVCHSFTADVPALATLDSARGTLVPTKDKCLGCHEMQKVLGDFDEAKDPHRGTCGMCHNPHEQKTPAAATKSCATAACHGTWRNEPFHVGASHRRVGADCLTCHRPHSAKVDASNCTGCHTDVRSRGRLQPPLPFDTTKALRRISHWITPLPAVPSVSLGSPRPHEPSNQVVGVGFTGNAPVLEANELSRAPPAPPDSFPHARHAKLACLVCHEPGSATRRLTFDRPRGCSICHHQAPTTARCPACHRTEQVAGPKAVTVTVTVPGNPGVPRPVGFLHSQHATRPCVECHTTPVTLSAAPATAQCKDCHAEHHEASRVCSTCHTMADPKTKHVTLEVAHQRCDACHTAATVARLTPSRTFCSTCHAAKAADHYEQKECSSCHFLADPAAYRAKLTGPPR
jgi:nitrate/TMAO reductase-like tetraheme cytochrome c subunit